MFRGTRTMAGNHAGREKDKSSNHLQAVIIKINSDNGYA
jgi:hypothetical protein